MTNETKWTPGPWKVTTKASVATPGLTSLVICEMSGNDTTAYVYKDRPANCDREAILSDAHLIAAAPELYEALWSLKEILLDEGVELPLDFFNEAYDALAKARGEHE